MVKTTISYNVSEYAMLSEQSVFRLTVPVAELPTRTRKGNLGEGGTPLEPATHCYALCL